MHRCCQGAVQVKNLLQYGSKKIEYELQFANRKSLGISVTPTMQVFVRAPHGANKRKVSEIIKKRADWILKQQDYFLAFYPKQPPKRYISGETHLYLGKQYRLSVRLGKNESVKLIGKSIRVTCVKKNNVKALLTNWYLLQARMKFDRYVENWIERFQKYQVSPTAIIVRPMSRRWGSCTPQGKIILNPELIKAPRGCIEYVIVHELCHLVHRNHTQKFMELQSKEMPQWEKWKARLETLLA